MMFSWYARATGRARRRGALAARTAPLRLDPSMADWVALAVYPRLPAGLRRSPPSSFFAAQPDQRQFTSSWHHLAGPRPAPGACVAGSSSLKRLVWIGEPPRASGVHEL